jgi:hypothetical protein
MSRLDQQVNAHPQFTPASGNGEPQSSVSAEDLLVQLFGCESTIATPLLNSPEPTISHYLDLQLRDLSTRNPEALDSRSSEILYLANLLMEGIGIQGERMTEEQAMNCVSQTCNLGMTYCVFQVPWDSELEIVSEFMERRPGLIRAFTIGFKLISELPVRVVSALEALLESNNVKKRFSKDPWIMSSVNAAFIALKTSPGDSYHFHQHLAELLDSLMLFCDASVCEQLRIIGDSFPRFPASLTPDAEPTTYVNRSWQFISTQLELELLRIFLHTLDRHLFGR